MEFIGPVEWPIQVDDGPTYFDLYYTEVEGDRYIVATKGDVSDTPSLLRIESSCVFGHVLDGVQCDCGDQLEQALATIAERGKGILVYALDEDARGHGVEMHFQLYIYRQHQGRTDEREIFDELGEPFDARDYSPVVDVLHEFDIDSVRIMTNNPDRLEFLEESSVEVDERVPIQSEITEYNHDLLLDEKTWMGYETDYLTDDEWLDRLAESDHDYLLAEGQSTVVSKGRIEDLSGTETVQELDDGFLTLYYEGPPRESVERELDGHVDRIVRTAEASPTSPRQD